MLTPLGPLPGQTDRQTAFPGSPLIPAATFTLVTPFHLPVPALLSENGIFTGKTEAGSGVPGPAPGTAPSVERPLPLCSPYEHSSLRHLEKQLGTPSPAWPLPPPEAAPGTECRPSIRLFSRSLFTSLAYGRVEVTGTEVVNAKSLALFFVELFLLHLSGFILSTLSSPKLSLVTLHGGRFPVCECPFANFSTCPDSALVPRLFLLYSLLRWPRLLQ